MSFVEDFENLGGPIQYNTLRPHQCPACGDPATLVVSADKKDIWGACHSCGRAGTPESWVRMANGDLPVPDPHYALERFLTDAYAMFRDRFWTDEGVLLRRSMDYADVEDPHGPPLMGMAPAREAAAAAQAALLAGGRFKVANLQALAEAPKDCLAAIMPIVKVWGRLAGLLTHVDGGMFLPVYERKGGDAYVRQGAHPFPGTLIVAGNPFVMLHVQTSYLRTGAPTGQLDMLYPLIRDPCPVWSKHAALVATPSEALFITDGPFEETWREPTGQLWPSMVLAKPLTPDNMRDEPVDEILRGATLTAEEASERLRRRNIRGPKDDLFLRGHTILKIGGGRVSQGLATFHPRPYGLYAREGSAALKLRQVDFTDVAALNEALEKGGIKFKLFAQCAPESILPLLKRITIVVERSKSNNEQKKQTVRQDPDQAGQDGGGDDLKSESQE